MWIRDYVKHPYPKCLLASSAKHIKNMLGWVESLNWLTISHHGCKEFVGLGTAIEQLGAHCSRNWNDGVCPKSILVRRKK